MEVNIIVIKQIDTLEAVTLFFQFFEINSIHPIPLENSLLNLQQEIVT